MTELRISSFSASSSVSQSTDIFKSQSLGHEFNTQANAPHLSVLSGESLFCVQLHWLQWFLLQSHRGSCSQPAAWMTGSARSIFSLQKAQQRDQPIPGLPPGDLASRWSVNNGGGLCPAPEFLLMGNCLDNRVYPFTGRHLPCS